MLNKTLIGLLIMIAVSPVAFADDDLFDSDSIYQSSCGIDTFGLYEGTVTMEAVYEDSVYNCEHGYYVPIATEGCVICPNDSYCSGGIYNYSTTIDQGIMPCPINHPYSPRGMWLESQCGRKLHVGNDVVYMHQSPANPTQHRLFVQYGNTNYSVNADPKSGVVPKMSAGAERSLHTIFDGVEHIIHDDSVE